MSSANDTLNNLKKGDMLRLKRSKRQVIVVWVQPSTHVPTPDPLATFQIYKPNTAWDEIPFTLPRSLWDDYLEPLETLAFA